MADPTQSADRLNILILANKSPFPPNDGSSLAVESMVRGFAEQGASVCVLAMNTSKHRKSEEDFPEDLIGKVRLRMVDVDNTPKALPALGNLLFSSESYVVSRFNQGAYRKALVKWLQEETFQYVQVEGLTLAHYVEDIRAHHFGPVILRSHNVEHLIWSRSAFYEGNSLKQWYLKLQSERLKKFELERSAQFDAIVPITATDTGAFKSFGIKLPMKTAFCGVDVANSKQEAFEETPKFFFVGAFDWLPNLVGINWLVDHVWPKIVGEEPEVELHILGRHSPPELQKVKGVFVHPDQNVAHSFFEKNQILLVPLKSGSGLRIKIVEAMSLGKAVVSTYVGAEGIHGQSGTHFYLEDEAGAFADKALELYRNRMFIQQMGNSARTFALKNFDRSSISAGLLEFYSSL